MDHLQQIFVCCRHYNIQLNPHKCIFGVKSSRFLGFIVANDGIRVDPLKVEAITNLPLPRTILQLQILQVKANFLRRFIINYAKITKGFMCLLKKWVPFIWDDRAHRSFDALKATLASTPVISPPNYQKYFLLYLAAYDTTVDMVLVQTDDVHIEHVIYYLNSGLVGVELKYPYIEKLALEAAFVVQKFCHYIILQTTTVISDANPMKYILSCRIIGGRYSKWVVILFEFDLIFSTPKAKKSLVFAELMVGLPQVSQPLQELESLPDDSLFLMDSSDPWYRDILVYLQTQRFRSSSTKDDRRQLRHLAQHYLIVGDALYHRGVDTVLRQCVTHEEAELIMNDCHSGACGSHLSMLATTQKILCTRYFWPSIFKDCITAVKKCHPC